MAAPVTYRIAEVGLALEVAIMEYSAVANEHPKPFVWTKTADEILGSNGRLCRRISDWRN